MGKLVGLSSNQGAKINPVILLGSNKPYLYRQCSPTHEQKNAVRIYRAMDVGFWDDLEITR